MTVNLALRRRRRWIVLALIAVLVLVAYRILDSPTGAGVEYESIARLHDPLGDRVVVDGSDRMEVRRANCPPPAVFAPVCP